MRTEEMKNQLVEGGLHEDSTEEALKQYEKMQFYLKNGEYEAAGVNVGKFCESIANILLEIFADEIMSKPEVGTILKKLDKHTNDTYKASDTIRVMLPRFIRAAYDIRNRRGSVHVNLDVSVSHSDTQTAVRMCGWMLSELIRTYGAPDDMDEIAQEIEEEKEERMEKLSEEIETLANPNYPLIDRYNGRKMVASNELELGEEVLVLLYTEDGAMDVDELVDSIPNESAHSVKSKLGNLKQNRKVFYDNQKGEAKIAKLGAEEAEKAMKKIEVNKID